MKPTAGALWLEFGAKPQRGEARAIVTERDYIRSLPEIHQDLLAVRFFRMMHSYSEHRELLISPSRDGVKPFAPGRLHRYTEFQQPHEYPIMLGTEDVSCAEPDLRCGCFVATQAGFYSSYTLALLNTIMGQLGYEYLSGTDIILAVVRVSGQVHLGRYGMRSEYLEILALYSRCNEKDRQALTRGHHMEVQAHSKLPRQLAKGRRFRPVEVPKQYRQLMKGYTNGTNRGDT